MIEYRNIISAEPVFITYIRTLMFWQQRFNNHPKVEPVYVPRNEIKDRFYPYPQYNLENELKALCDSSMLEVSTITKGERKIYNYRALQPGMVNPTLLNPKGRELDRTTQKMMNYLKMVDIPQDTPSSLYFDTFLKLKDKFLRLFFTVDDFSGRVHTPVTSIKGEYRKNLLIQGSRTISLDVVTMQPVLLGKILKEQIGNNEYSRWINSGKDIYEKLQDKARLETRKMAKKKFFQILFNVADGSLAKMFGNADWINWINEYKSRLEESNPHSLEKNHSNLAWLLQTTEVGLMRKVWGDLIKKDIPFLSVHDEIIVREEQAEQAEGIFNQVLRESLFYFKLSSKNKRQPIIIARELPNATQRKTPILKPLKLNEKLGEVRSNITEKGIFLPEPKKVQEHRTLDDIFKYYYKKGYKSLPAGIQINADNWDGNVI